MRIECTLFSTIAILLTSSPFKLSDVMIGLISVIAVFGALFTAKVGKLADRGHTQKLTGLGILTFVISWIFLYFGGQYLISYVLGYGIICLALVLVHTSNQSIIFRLRPDAKSRINSIYMTGYFAGGACGSALGVYAWNHGGWSMTCMLGIGLVACAALFALLDHYSHAKYLTAQLLQDQSVES